MRLTAFVVWATCATASALAQPRITFEKQSVIAEGLTPGAPAVVFGVARETPTWLTRIVPHVAVISGEQNPGKLSYDAGSSTGSDSVWAVVDVATGDYAVAVPDGAPQRPIDAEELGLQAGQARFLLAREGYRAGRLHVLLVRPGVGAWSLFSRDGGQFDHDGAADSGQLLDVSEFNPLTGADEPPDWIARGDVIIAMDSRDMTFLAVRVGAL